jgi:uncharacterized protein YydD (DUF2326 family)
MFLETLKIEKRSEVIRDITFRKGINFIIDETPESKNPQSTGNNVGKTTVLRLVDYCFGADGKNIYQDTEFKKQPNTTVENFLKDNEVIISITLVDDLSNPTKKSVDKKELSA